eukprot:scaffold10637_cov86-Isochrysis_galbana.AAC.1
MDDSSPLETLLKRDIWRQRGEQFELTNILSLLGHKFVLNFGPDESGTVKTLGPRQASTGFRRKFDIKCHTCRRARDVHRVRPDPDRGPRSASEAKCSARRQTPGPTEHLDQKG